MSDSLPRDNKANSSSAKEARAVKSRSLVELKAAFLVVAGGGPDSSRPAAGAAPLATAAACSRRDGDAEAQPVYLATSPHSLHSPRTPQPSHAGLHLLPTPQDCTASLCKALLLPHIGLHRLSTSQDSTFSTHRTPNFPYTGSHLPTSQKLISPALPLLHPFLPLPQDSPYHLQNSTFSPHRASPPPPPPPYPHIPPPLFFRTREHFISSSSPHLRVSPPAHAMAR
ncbi:hypothetical protein E2C01_028540 [Portunus trituberculatus]|uniref:Uncharacterized protein n=1 Tax=Portunus trituberculatus TaxID=210409 RepID=A0A5B7EP10_PORTR|nr:hypothetical protein [Portunus trituberculatus]